MLTRRSKWVFMLILMSTALFVGGAFAQTPAPPPEIDLSAKSHDYGLIKVGYGQDWVLRVANRGLGLLDIYDIISDNPDFQITDPDSFPQSVEYSGGRNPDSLYVTVTFIPSFSGQSSGKLTVLSNDADEGTLYVSLVGTGVAPEITLFETTHDFNGIVVGSSSDWILALNNIGPADLLITEIVTTDPNYYISAPTQYPQSVPSGGKLDVIVTFAPTSGGVKTANLIIKSDDPDEGTLYVSLIGTGLAADIELSATAHDYGEHMLGTSSSWMISVYNSGTLDLIVSHALTDLLDFSVVSPSFPQTVNPGGSLFVEISFQPVSIGFREGSLTLRSNDPDEGEMVVVLTGTGLPRSPDIDIFTASHDFGNVLVGTSSTWDFQIRNQGLVQLTINSIIPDLAEFSVVSPSFPQDVPPGEVLLVTVTFTPISEGERTGTLTIRSTDPDEGVLTISVFGTAIAPDVVIPATSHDFGQVVLGNSNVWFLEFSNQGAAGLIIESIVSSHPNFVITDPIFPITIPSGESRTQPILFIPSSLGMITGNLTISTNDPDEPVLLISVSGMGVKPDIFLSADSHDFGDVIVGESTPWQLTLQNLGTAALSVSSVISNNPAFTLAFPSFPQTVEPGDALEVTVVFSPTREGEITGNLTVISNDLETETLVIRLSGIGLPPPAPRILLAENAHDFESIEVGKSSQWRVHIYNKGDLDLIVSKATSDNPDFQVVHPPLFPNKVKPLAHMHLLIDFVPSKAGTRTGHISVFSNDPKNEIVSINLTGYGSAPEIEVSSLNHNYGKVLLLNPQPWVMRITNQGSKVLNITQVDSDEEEFVITSPTFPQMVPPGMSLDVTVIFTPISEGEKAGTITIMNDDPNEALISVQVAGIGAASKIHVSEGAYDFGATAVGDTSTWTFIITNVGEEDLVVDHISSTHPDFMILTPPFPQNLRKYCGIEITIAFTPSSAGQEEASLSIFSNDSYQPCSPFLVQGTGIAPDIEFSALSHNYGDVLLGESRSWTLVLSNEGILELVIDSVVSDMSDFRIESPSFPQTVEPGGHINVMTLYNPTELGEGSGHFTVYSDDYDEGTVTISLAGRGVSPEIELSAMSYDFGQIWTGDCETWTLTITNFGSYDLIISDVRCDVPGFTIVDPTFPQKIHPHCDLDVTVSFCPDTVGLKICRLVIETNHPLVGEVNVLLKGEGVLPEIAASALDYNFGGLAIGESSDWTLTLFNRGTAPLTIEEIQLTNIVDFNIPEYTFPFVIHPKASIDIPVVFEPQSSTHKQSDLIIKSDDPSTPVLTIHLRGKGLVRDILLSEKSHDFGSVVVGQQSKWSFTITNLGQLYLDITEVVSSHSDFTITSPTFPFTLGSGASVNVVVDFSPSSMGVKAGTLEVQSDDPDEGIQTLTLIGVGIAPELEFSSYSHDFGDVMAGACSAWEIAVHNKGTYDLELLSVTIDHVDFRATVPSLPLMIAPGDSQNIEITFCPSVPGPASGNLNVCVDGAIDDCLLIPLTGRGILQDIALSTDSYDFGIVRVGGTSNGVFMISNDGTADLTVYEVVSDGEEFVVTSPSFPLTLEPGDSAGVIVAFTPLDVSVVSAALTVKSDDPDEESLTIRVQGEGGLPDIELMEASHDFGEVPVGQSSEWTLIISNAGKLDLGVEDIWVEGTGFGVEVPDRYPPTPPGWSLGPGDRFEVLVIFSPYSAGAKSGLLTIQSDDPDEEVITVSLTGKGINADILLSETVYDFGFVPVSGSVEWAFTISNVGRQILHLTHVQSTHSDFAVTAPSFPITLSAGESEDVFVTFTPSSVGAVVGTLFVLSDDPDEGTVQMMLQGFGTSPEVEFSDYGHDFDKVLVDECDTWPVTITNTGSYDLEILNVTVDNPDFHIDTPPLPVTIGQGESQVWTVTYCPSVAGIAHCNIEVCFNGIISDCIFLSLAGTGVVPDIAFSVTSHNYGPVYKGGTSNWVLMILNAGTADLTVSDVVVEGDMFQIVSPLFPQILPPDNSIGVVVAFTPSDVGLVSGNLIVFSDDPDEGTVVIPLEGEGVLPGLHISESSHDFGTIIAGDSSVWTLTLSNTGGARLTISEVLSDSPDFIVIDPTFPQSLGPGESVDVTVLFAPITSGEKAGSLTITTDDPQAPVVTVAFMAKAVVSDIHLSENQHDFGKVLVGSTSTWSFIISNGGKADMMILDIISNISEFVVVTEEFPLTIAPGESIDVGVNFTPPSIMKFLGVLTIHIADYDDDPPTVLLVGEGIQQDIRVSALSHDFGNVVVGDSSEWFLEISNDGTANLTVDTVFLDRGNFVLEDVILPFVVSPDSHVSIGVTFRPSSAQVSEGHLTIVSDDPDEGEIVVTLTGRGVDADVYTSVSFHDYGGVMLGGSADWTFQLYNIGKVDLHVEDVMSGCGEFLITSPEFPQTLGRGEQLDVTVSFLPTEAEEVTCTLAVITDDPDEGTLYIIVTGRGVGRQIDVTDRGIGFGDIRVGNSVEKMLTIYNRGLLELTVDAILSSHDDYAVAAPTFPYMIGPVDSVDVTIIFTPSDTGLAEGILNIGSNDPAQPLLSVTVSGRGIAPEIDISAESHDYGKVCVGTASNWVLMIRNIGSDDLIVSEAFIDNDEFAIVSPAFPQTVPVDSSLGVVVQFIPLKVGPSEGTVTIVSDDGDESTLTVTLAGEGALPDIELSATVHDFGDVIAGDTSLWTLTVSNVGNAELVLKDISSDHANFSVLSPEFPNVVPPDGSIDVIVAFIPTSGREVFGHLTVESNDPDEATRTVSVTGVGIAADLYIGIDGHDFGDVVIGDTATWVVPIHNIGLAQLTIDMAAVQVGDFRLVSPTFPQTVNPGKSVDVSIRFIPSALGYSEGKVTFTSNDLFEPSVDLLLSGNGVSVPLLKVVGGFGDPGSSGNTVYIDLHTPLAIGAVEFNMTYDSDLLTITDAQLTGYSKHMGIFNIAFPHADQIVILVQDLNGAVLPPPSGSVVELTIRVAADAPMDILPLNLIGVILYGADGDPVPFATENGTFTVTVPDINVPVREHDFGRISLNRPAEWPCLVTNGGTKDLIISHVSADRIDFYVTEPTCPCTIAVAETVAIVFRFTPSVVGPIRATATVESSDPDEGSLMISLNGYGIRPDICIGEVIHDFGEVLVGTSSTWTAPATNLGKGELILDTIFTVNADFAVEELTYPLTVMERESVFVDVTFAPSLAGAIRGSLVVMSNDPDEGRFVLPLWGRGIAPDIDVAALSHDFGEVDVGMEIEADIMVYNRGRAELTIDSVRAQPIQFSVRGPNFPQTVAAGGSVAVTASFAPTFIGDVAGTLIIFSDDPDEGELSVTLIGRGAAPDIALSATSYIFSRVKLGESEEWEFTLSNRGTRDLIVESITPDTSDFIVISPVFPQTIEPGAEITVLVSFQPSVVGMISGRLTIRSNDPDEETLHVTLLGHGAEPEIELSTVSLDFGDVALGASKDLAFMVHNLGDADLILTHINSSHADFTIAVLVFPVTISKRDSLEVVVTYTPSTMGAVEGSLLVASDDADESILSVEFTGEGIPPATLRAGNGHGTPGSGNNPVFVYLDNSIPVATIRFLINFDPDLLSVSNVQATTRAAHMGSFDWNIPHAGEILVIISGFGDEVIEPGAGSIVRIGFDVASEAEFGTDQLTLAGVALFDLDENEILTGIQNGFFTVGTSYVYNFGDVLLGQPSSITLNYSLPIGGNCDVVIGEIECDNPDFAVAAPCQCPFVVSLSQCTEVRLALVFTPSQTGEEWGLISLGIVEPEEETILLPVVGRGVAAGQASWTVDVVCVSSDVSLPDSVRTKKLTFGVDPEGTDHFDSGLDLPLPPIAPGSKFEVHFPESTFIGRLSKDIRSTSSKNIEWTIETMYTAGTISWNPADLPEGNFKLNGTVDMKSVGEASFSKNETMTIAYTSTESAVQLSYLAVEFGEEWATVVWETAYEENLAGFNVYRVGRSGVRPTAEHKRNNGLITGSFSYSFSDKTVVPGEIYYYWIEAIGEDGSATFVGSVSGRATLPQNFVLSQNYPNPFNPETHIHYTIHTHENVSLIIYNSLGQQVRVLIHTPQSPGTYSVTWDGLNDHGRLVPTGTYFYRLTVGTVSETKKMVMLK